MIPPTVQSQQTLLGGGIVFHHPPSLSRYDIVGSVVRGVVKDVEAHSIALVSARIATRLDVLDVHIKKRFALGRSDISIFT